MYNVIRAGVINDLHSGYYCIGLITKHSDIMEAAMMTGILQHCSMECGFVSFVFYGTRHIVIVAGWLHLI